VKETASKAHMQVHTNKGSREKQPGRKPGPNRAEMGLGEKHPEEVASRRESSKSSRRWPRPTLDAIIALHG
jgi:hypothetical protein